MQKFNRVLQNLQKLKDEEVSRFYNNLNDVSSQSAALLCIHSEEEAELEAFLLENIASEMNNVSKKFNSGGTHCQIFRILAFV